MLCLDCFIATYRIDTTKTHIKTANLIKGQNSTQRSDARNVCDKTWDNALKKIFNKDITLINAREKEDAVVQLPFQRPGPVITMTAPNRIYALQKHHNYLLHFLDMCLTVHHHCR